MSEKQKVIIFGGSKGVGKAIVKMLEEKGKYEITEVSRTSGYDLLNDNIALPMDEADLFIYCTGVGHFHDKGKLPENIHNMIQLNLEIPISLTYRVNARHYLYIGSNSAYFGFGGSDVYCAVKHGILGFARALRKSGKKVSVISPGTVDTDFWNGSGRERPDLYQRPEDVAEAVMSCIENKANIEELLIMPHQENV